MMKTLTIEEREDVILIIKAFKPHSWGCVAMFYNNSFSKARGRRFTANELKNALT